MVENHGHKNNKGRDVLSGLALRTKIILFAGAMFVALNAIALLGLQSLRHASESDNIARIQSTHEKHDKYCRAI